MCILVYTHSQWPRSSRFGMPEVKRGQGIPPNYQPNRIGEWKRLALVHISRSTIYPFPLHSFPWETDVFSDFWLGAANGKSREGYQRKILLFSVYQTHLITQEYFFFLTSVHEPGEGESDTVLSLKCFYSSRIFINSSIHSLS